MGLHGNGPKICINHITFTANFMFLSLNNNKNDETRREHSQSANLCQHEHLKQK